MRLLNRIGRNRLACLVLVFGMAAPITLLVIRASQTYCAYPSDPRAYTQPDCSDGTTTSFTTLSESLSTFDIPMPHDAQGVRFYIDPGSFRASYAFFLRFAAPAPEVTELLTKLGASRSTTTAKSMWQEWSSEPVPWTFNDSTQYTVYTFTDTADVDIDDGVAIVDRSQADAVVYLYIYSS